MPEGRKNPSGILGTSFDFLCSAAAEDTHPGYGRFSISAEADVKQLSLNQGTESQSSSSAPLRKRGEKNACRTIL